MSERQYTAQEMRESASICESVEVADQFYSIEMDRAAVMLRQAADMREILDAVNKVVDDELKKQAHCRGCEWRGKSIRSEPACPCGEDVHGVVFDIDVTDRIVKVLRGDAEKGTDK